MGDENTKFDEESGAKYLYLIDGDNHINKALKNIEYADKMDEVRVYVTQKALYDKLVSKNYNYVKLYLVQPGDQAVDKKIEEVLRIQAFSRSYRKIFVISQDHGYDELIEHLRKELNIKKSKLDRRDYFCEVY
ncbi:MAG: hypothetical protein K6E27_04895 [Eubacterium sp.]|nr:hypothetical protein [Eubacterium sp.]